MPDRPSFSRRGTGDDQGLVGNGRDVWELVVAYAKQETTEPLKGLGKWVAFGLAGSMLIAIGVMILLLALLRSLQTETGSTFTGNWSWAPYLITLVVAAGVAAVSVKVATRKRGK